jgi:hypothetical protein
MLGCSGENPAKASIRFSRLRSKLSPILPPCMRSVAEYRQAILAAVQVEHLTVEVGRCPHHEAA